MVAEQAEQRNHPEIAGFRCTVTLAGNSFFAALKDAQQVLGIGPGASDLIFHLNSGIKGKVFGKLAGDIALLDPVQDVGGKDSAFDTVGKAAG